LKTLTLTLSQRARGVSAKSKATTVAPHPSPLPKGEGMNCTRKSGQEKASKSALLCRPTFLVKLLKFY